MFGVDALTFAYWNFTGKMYGQRPGSLPGHRWRRKTQGLRRFRIHEQYGLRFSGRIEDARYDLPQFQKIRANSRSYIRADSPPLEQSTLDSDRDTPEVKELLGAKHLNPVSCKAEAKARGDFHWVFNFWAEQPYLPMP
jgi:hypothetical protein